MNFSDKLQSSIRVLSHIDRPDFPMSNINIYADFIELLALLSDIDGIAYGDIQDRFFGEPSEDNNAENNDHNEAFIDEIYERINERISLYKEAYPFNKNDNNVIVLKRELTAIQKVYIFLLISSSLNVFISFNSELTTDFETLCYEVMKMYLPNAIVKSFGKKSEYSGSAKEKIRQLAKDIGLSVDEYEIKQIEERNVQERGLDIVCWLPFKDNCSNIVVFLGQCACGKSFESKQHDTRRFENYYLFYKTKPQHTLFIPYSLINPQEGKFYHSDYIEQDYLIFERLRLINTIKDNDSIYDQLVSKDLIEQCINYSPNV